MNDVILMQKCNVCTVLLQANEAYHHPSLGIEINIVVAGIHVVDDRTVKNERMNK